MSKELDLWKSKFGDDYVNRNQLDDSNIMSRINMWSHIYSTSFREALPNRILEVGAGIGGNINALDHLNKSISHSVILHAVEPNNKAQEELQKLPVSLVRGDALSINAPDFSYDLVFTSGVLIHIHPDNLLQAMKEIYRVSSKYIICNEYFSPELRELKYHGEQALWTNDFGSLWLNNFKLRCVNYNFYWKRLTGIDNTMCWIFEKVN